MLTIGEKTSHLQELSNKKVSSINNRQTLTLKCYTSAGQYLNCFCKHGLKYTDRRTLFLSYSVDFTNLSFATIDICSRARAWGISDKWMIWLAVWVQTDSNLGTNRSKPGCNRPHFGSKRPDTEGLRSSRT